MSQARAASALLLLALAAAPATAQAQASYDPAFEWRTLTTPHFLVHFHQGEEALAQRVAATAERAHARLTPLLGYAPPGRTHLVLSDDQDDANGSATPVPRNVIRLFAVPPESASVLQDARDWLTQLVDHEYVHVLHTDQVGGIPAVLNAVFGKLLVPNGMTPGWLIEGIAVAHEATDDATGRNRSALFDMYARALALEPPGLPDLEVLTNQPLEWPRGHQPYLLGGRFVEWILARSGPEALRRFIADQGSRLWPWAPGWAAERWLGGDFPTLWSQFRAELRRRSAAQLAAIRARPVTRPARLTSRGGLVERPRWTPDGGALVYLDHGPEERGGLRRVSAAGADLGLAWPVDLHGQFALRSGREAVVARAQVWREFRVYDDLWLADLDGGPARRLTDGERATDPALTPDGQAVVYVARVGGGELELRRRPLAGGPAEPLLRRDGAQLYDPAVSPDGRRIALSLQEGGRRDLAVLEEGRLARITDDDALDLQPAWTPDGRWLLFASDRGGVFNLHAWSPETRELRQVTNVETGALDPAVSPDGRTIAFVTYGRSGHDLATIPFEPERWLEEAPASIAVAAAAAAATGGSSGTPAGSASSAEAPLSTSAGLPVPPSPGQVVPASTGPAAPAFPSSPYRPWTALPTVWLPTWSVDDAGNTFGAVTAGSDVVGHHTWQAAGWWSERASTAGYSVAYLGGWSWPALDLWSERLVEAAPGLPARLTSAWTPLGAGATFSVTRLERALRLRLGWSATRWRSLDQPDPALPAPPPQWRFDDGTLSEASLGAAYSDARRYSWSISPEEGRSLSFRLRLGAPELGSDYALWRARASWAEYLRVPGTRHAVMAARLSGALAHGSLGGSPPFGLGGATLPSPADVFLLQDFPTRDQLRGYPADRLAGNGIALANLELRLPITNLETGNSTWPIYFRRLHGALFLDAGEAFVQGTERGYTGRGFRWDRLRLGAGAELRVELVLAYWLLTDLRFGVARGLGRPFAGESPGQDPLAEWQGYVTFGPSF